MTYDDLNNDVDNQGERPAPIQNFQDLFRLGDVASVALMQQTVRAGHQPGAPGALDGGMTVEARPSWYAGVTFRSKLEADWAATLDTLGITWQYEPERIVLPSGKIYVPDFWLPELRTWIEVKGPGVPRVEKAIELGRARACHCAERCDCEWDGGQLVLVAHETKPFDTWSGYEDLGEGRWRISRRALLHRGHPQWYAAYGRSAWLTRCPTCQRAGWFAMIAPLRCRACRSRLTGGCHAYASGDEQLEFVDSSGRPSVADLGDDPAEATA